MTLFARREKPLTSPITSAFIMLGAALVALIVGAGLMSLMGANPIDGYRELVIGMAGTKQNIAESLLKATPLLIIGLGIAIAFTASIWNIGAEGQFYMGALFSTWLVLLLPDLPWYGLIPLAIIAAGVSGGIWGGIVGYLRARFGVNEIIVTVMMNYLAIFFVRFMVQGPLRETQTSGAGFPRTDPVPASVWLPRLIPHTRLHVGFIAALVLAERSIFCCATPRLAIACVPPARIKPRRCTPGLTSNASLFGAWYSAGRCPGWPAWLKCLGCITACSTEFHPVTASSALLSPCWGNGTPWGL